MADEFRQAIIDSGLIPPDFIQSGEFLRFAGIGKSSGNKAGYCRLFEDGKGGIYGDWSTDFHEVWHEKNNYSPIEKKAFDQQVKAARKKIEQKRKQLHENASAEALNKWNKAAPETGNHKYLVNKNIQPHGIKTDGFNLLIPMYDAGGKLCSIQTITPNGGKLFHKSGRVKGCYYPIGKPNGVLCLCEGFATGATIYEATGHAVAVCFNAGNLQDVAKSLRRKLPDLKLIICADDDHEAQANVGLKKASEAAASVDGVVAVPDFDDSRNGNTDFNDMARLFDNAAVARVINEAKESQQKNDGMQVAELAKLSPFDYEKVREEASKYLGVRVTALDKEVKEHQAIKVDADTQLVVEDLTTWEHPVDGNELLNIIESTLNRHVVLPTHCSTAISLWIMGTYCMDSWRVWSKLLITSPQKRCGKSVLMETLEGMVYRPLLTSNISASALFRSIEMWKPTLLIDEADTFTADNDELNGIINCGHTRRTARVIRSEKVGDSHEPKVFMVWSPQVIAGIGKQRATLEDRSIQILMRRRSPGEKSEKLSVDYFENQTTLRRKLMRWSEDNTAVLSKLKVSIPTCGNDRAEDNWRSLFVVAERIGGKWSEKVKEAYTHLTKTDDDEAGTMLLCDIKKIFETCNRIHSDELVNKLVAMDDRPWNEWKHGFPLTKNTISNLLKPYQIKTKQLKINGVNRHGYEKSSFDDAFKRYLSPPSINTPYGNATTLQPSYDAGCSGNQNATPKYSENQNATLKRPPDADCSEVAFQKGVIDEGGVFKL